MTPVSTTYGLPSTIEVVIVGASPDRINHNAIMRHFVHDGFASTLGAHRVTECPLESAITTVDKLRPRLVLCFGSCMPDVSDYGPLRDLCDRVGVNLAFWLHDDPYEFDFAFKATEVADFVFSNDRWATRHYDHPHVQFLPMAACPNAHSRPWVSDKRHDVFFCGVGFPNRVRILSDLQPFLGALRCEVLGAEWPDSLKVAHNKRLTNAEVADECAASLVTLNMGRDLHLANRRYQLDPSTPGPRTFEAAMAGTVQLCFVDGLEIADYFKIGDEILVFDDPASFRQQVESLLDDPLRAKRVALAARERVLKDHTYEQRARQLLACCGWSQSEIMSEVDLVK